MLVPETSSGQALTDECRSGGTGRRAILRGWCLPGVRVRLPPSAPKFDFRIFARPNQPREARLAKRRFEPIILLLFHPRHFLLQRLLFGQQKSFLLAIHFALDVLLKIAVQTMLKFDIYSSDFVLGFLNISRGGKGGVGRCA
jgi:hypothetical protein